MKTLVKRSWLELGGQADSLWRALQNEKPDKHSKRAKKNSWTNKVVRVGILLRVIHIVRMVLLAAITCAALFLLADSFFR